MEKNITTLKERLSGNKVGFRPHLKTAKSPQLAHILLDAGAIGGCVAKVSEAEVMADAGIEDLLITSEIVGKPKVQRLVELVRKHPKVKTVVDSLAGAKALNQAMEAANQTLDVLIEIDVGQHRCGVQPGEATVVLAQQLKSLPFLRFRGVQGYQGHAQLIANAEERLSAARKSMDLLILTVAQLRAAGFGFDIVTTGGTGTLEICASYPDVTELQPGSFLVMDAHYRHVLGPVYGPALTLLTTVLSRPEPYRAVIDAGLKSLSIDSGMAEPKDWLYVNYKPLGDEHGSLTWDAKDAGDDLLKVGDRLEMIPSHCDTTINLFDTYYAHRNGKVEAIWPIASRGKVQ
jgi:D-serine deaminase-like pyridoxal phosphate-dependent protein